MKTTAPTENRSSSLWQPTDADGVKRAAGKEAKALEELYLKYRTPLRVLLLGKFRSYPEILRNSEDLLSAFKEKRMLADGWLKKWKPEKGRFRDFLRTSLINFVWDWWRGQSDPPAPPKEQWKKQSYFAAIDWFKDHYDVIVLARAGMIVAEFQFAHQPAGWNEFDQEMRPFRGCPFAFSPSRSAPEQLLRRDHPLYQADSRAAKRFKEGKAPSHVTAGRRGLWALADAFRTDGYAWWPLRPVSGYEPASVHDEHHEDENEDFSLSCAQAVIRKALDRLEGECKDPKRAQPRYTHIWEILRLRFLDPLFKGTKPPAFEELIKLLNIPPASDPAFMLWTAKRMFREHLENVMSEDPGSGTAKSELLELTQFVDRLEENSPETKAKKKQMDSGQ